MNKWLHSWAAPMIFYDRAGRLLLPLWTLAAVLTGIGVIWGLFLAPADYLQGDAFRIIYVHVPSAWMAMFIYMFMASAALVALVWRVKLAEVLARESAPIGAVFTALALATGSLWGKPMWGTWWVWDARLTSVLLLLFLYLGFIGLQNAIDDRRLAARAGAVLALVGVVNIPIIHYSVVWWNTLHQGASVSRLDAPAIDPSMLWPLLLVAAGFTSYFGALLLLRARLEILAREAGRRWVAERMQLANR